MFANACQPRDQHVSKKIIAHYVQSAPSVTASDRLQNVVLSAIKKKFDERNAFRRFYSFFFLLYGVLP